MGVLAAPTESSSSLVDEQAFVCSVPASSPEGLRSLALWNCDLVNRTIQDYRDAIAAGKGFNDNQQEVWEDKEAQAGEACRIAEALLNGTDSDLERAANYAVNAWGTVIAGGSECCIYPGSPICISNADWSVSVTAVLLPFAVLLLLFAASWLTSWCLPKKREERALLRKDTVEVQDSPGAAARGVAADAGLLEAELRGAWLAKSCLRVLPEAQGFAGASASLFSALREAFDFQADNVRNQHEHLLSLWRSQVAQVADRAIDRQEQVDEAELLAEALGVLHSELLEGFVAWRENLRRCAGARVPAAAGGLPSMAGAEAAWERGGQAGCRATGESGADLSRKLAEVAAFLLVWGEAGNLRFMPEVVYFITELALAAGERGLERLYGSAHPGGHSHHGPYHSGQFLAKVVRPIYNAVFDEWYESVDVDPASQKDKKKLKAGFENFLPADVANYDDWNEFFCDPERLVEGLILQDGTLLFELPHDMRFAALRRVDWEVSLDAAETKTHREIHSLWGVFASTHRVWLLHWVMFLAGVCLVAGDAPVPADGIQPLLGTTLAQRFAAVGLLVPVHAAAWTFARWQVTGRAVRKRRRGVLCVGRLVVRFALYAAPAATYVAIRATDSDGFVEEGYGEYHNLALAVHYCVSMLGLWLLLFLPSGRYANWKLTTQSLSGRAVRYTFWFLVLAVKMGMGLIIFRTIFEAIEDLGIVMPGRESYRDISKVYLTTGWVSSVLRWIVLWATTLLLFVSDTQLWFTLGCTFLGVGITFVQRGVRKAAKFSVEDAVAKIPERFSKKVLSYSKAQAALKSDKQAAPFSPYFPLIWDRVMEYMRYEDKIDNQMMGDLSFGVGDSGRQVSWRSLQQPLRQAGAPRRRADEQDDARDLKRSRVKVPDVFREKGAFEVGFKHYCNISKKKKRH
ncbi:unnamed protein product [Prorocentrum cordatum]|uniref:1,3-beta-glucan synthase component FKS1-like domain-containing protein n=1 Tax=Prorocentrum cordatum TaxID=2364126 RepID=A0ABN9T7Q4_9DINO|nr:unnamed protein product [Polarella glacialis]